MGSVFHRTPHEGGRVLGGPWEVVVANEGVVSRWQGSGAMAAVGWAIVGNAVGEERTGCVVKEGQRVWCVCAVERVGERERERVGWRRQRW